ncbi:MAG: hypothetical protein KA713_01370 [Chryseotalea sp. WA131a]|nr:MAG: hypothetical protein KA713_01370 [Chryseotalea sp. WA131a]
MDDSPRNHLQSDDLSHDNSQRHFLADDQTLSLDDLLADFSVDDIFFCSVDIKT